MSPRSGTFRTLFEQSKPPPGTSPLHQISPLRNHQLPQGHFPLPLFPIGILRSAALRYRSLSSYCPYSIQSGYVVKRQPLMDTMLEGPMPIRRRISSEPNRERSSIYTGRRRYHSASFGKSGDTDATALSSKGNRNRQRDIMQDNSSPGKAKGQMSPSLEKSSIFLGQQEWSGRQFILNVDQPNCGSDTSANAITMSTVLDASPVEFLTEHPVQSHTKMNSTSSVAMSGSVRKNGRVRKGWGADLVRAVHQEATMVVSHGRRKKEH